MQSLGFVLFLTLAGSVFSLLGGILLALRKRKFSHSENLLITSFTAGVILATAFFDLLPEAFESGEVSFVPVFAGIAFLFLFEKSLIWYHHHGHKDESGRVRTPLMIIVGDTIHNFIDGIVIAASALVSPATGILTALAVGAHEIPQEIGDFGFLLSKGWKRGRVILANLLSASAALVGAAITFFARDAISGILPSLLAFAGGMFTYLACSDLIPELHHGCDENCEAPSNLAQLGVFAAGAGIVYFLANFLG